jgi:hypothetical protein
MKPDPSDFSSLDGTMATKENQSRHFVSKLMEKGGKTSKDQRGPFRGRSRSKTD